MILAPTSTGDNQISFSMRAYFWLDVVQTIEVYFVSLEALVSVEILLFLVRNLTGISYGHQCR